MERQGDAAGGDRIHGLAGARMRAGTPAVPVWIPALRSGSGTGFAGNTMALRRPHEGMKMAAAFGESEDAGGDARAPSLGPRLRGDDGWCAGMTLPVWKAAPGATFIAKTMALPGHIRG